MKSYLSICFYISTYFLANSQSPVSGGEFVFEGIQCISKSERQRINSMLQNNVATLKKTQHLSINKNLIVSFDWPIKLADHTLLNNCYAISNFVDHNPVASGNQFGATNLDYNCGNRTYDTSDGYNHQGIDMFTWPFQWYQYEENIAEVVAAADGIIIGKDDGNVDTHCSCIGNWNAVYVQHSDGSRAWYGHLKTGSLTSKANGTSITAGEYLGIVASSGCSTAPHLHFEVYDNANNLIDPYDGPCNSMNSTSWWSSQQDYREPTLNALLTHNEPPELGCPAINETDNIQTCFTHGQTLYTALYFRDQMNSDLTEMRIRLPNNSIWSSWSHTSPDTYDASYWYWSWTLPFSGGEGTWKFEVDYRGQTFTQEFNLISSTSSPNIWMGPNTSYWNERVTNWSKGYIPTTCDRVVIPNGSVVNIEAGQTVNCYTLEVESNADLCSGLGAIVNVVASN